MSLERSELKQDHLYVYIPASSSDFKISNRRAFRNIEKTSLTLYYSSQHSESLQISLLNMHFFNKIAALAVLAAGPLRLVLAAQTAEEITINIQDAQAAVASAQQDAKNVNSAVEGALDYNVSCCLYPDGASFALDLNNLTRPL